MATERTSVESKAKRSFNLRFDVIDALERIKKHHGFSDNTATLEFIITKEARELPKPEQEFGMRKPIYLSELRQYIGQQVSLQLIDHNTKIFGAVLEWGYLTVRVRLLDAFVNAQTRALEYLKIEDSQGREHIIERGLVNGLYA